MTKGMNDVARERDEQRAKWGADHDAEHVEGEIAASAALLLLQGMGLYVQSIACKLWEHGRVETFGLEHRPWTRRKQLVVAAALVIAEIDRLDLAEEQGRTLPTKENPRHDPTETALAEALDALRDVLAIARLKVRKVDPESADKLVEFCARANIRPAVTR